MNIEAIILAAGKGTRMKSDLPKVMHNVAGKPMIAWIIEALTPVCDVLNVVTGHGRGIVEDFIGKNFPDVKFSFQAVQNGTGGAKSEAGKSKLILNSVIFEMRVVSICLTVEVFGSRMLLFSYHV